MNLGFGLNINDTAQESGYDQYKSSLFESLGAVAADNWNFNPGSSLVLWSQKNPHIRAHACEAQTNSLKKTSP